MNEHKNIEVFLNHAADHYGLEIKECNGDSVSLYPNLKFPFVFFPISIIYHRGIFFVVGIAKEIDKVLALNIHQVITAVSTGKSFSQHHKKYKERVNLEMKNRFGITQNMDHNVYNIELEFSSITGAYVKNHRWHETQVCTNLPNENWLMKMRCGINRELVGWIFQWMGNVKIINPPELKELYNQQLEKMTNLNKGSELQYSNIFQPD